MTAASKSVVPNPDPGRIVPVRWLRTVGYCLLVTLVTVWPYTAILAMLLWMTVAIWLPCNLITFVRRPELIRQQVFHLALWTLTAAIAASAHWYYAAEARSAAERYVASIERFRAANGKWPANLHAIGVGDEGAWRWHLHYMLFGAQPGLDHGSTEAPFDQWEYHFDSHTWEYFSD